VAQNERRKKYVGNARWRNKSITVTDSDSLLNIAEGRFLLSSIGSDIATQSAVKEKVIYCGQELDAPAGDYKVLDAAEEIGSLTKPVC
jgi:hypothetical protein